MGKSLLLALSLAACGQAGTVYIEFTSGTAQTGPAALPGGPNATWQTFSTNPNGTNLALDDTSGNPTGLLLSYTSTQNYTGGCCGGFGAGYGDLADGYLSQHSGFGTGTVTLSGFAPDEAFSLYLYSERDCGCSSGTFSVNGSPSQTTATGLPSAFVLNQNYLVFTGAADSNGKVTIDYAPAGGSGEGEINGIQLVSSAAPEPGPITMVLGGLALVCAGQIRRRRGR
jgi:hypothetical protein